MGCRNLTTFDIMCEDESIVYILSGSPCQSNTTVTITMINKKTQKITMKTVTDDINDPIKLGRSIWVKVFKNGSSKICGRQPLKNLK